MSNHPHADKRSYMYRIFDAQGRLIYVGSTHNPEARIYSHRQVMWWSGTIHRIKIQVFPNRQAAMDAEREAIQTEHPRWNINLRNWDRPGWGRQNLKDFIMGMEMFHEHMTAPRVKRIQVAKKRLAALDAMPIAA